VASYFLNSDSDSATDKTATLSDIVRAVSADDEDADTAKRTSSRSDVLPIDMESPLNADDRRLLWFFLVFRTATMGDTTLLIFSLLLKEKEESPSTMPDMNATDSKSTMALVFFSSSSARTIVDKADLMHT
jgi:hypothetical protein